MSKIKSEGTLTIKCDRCGKVINMSCSDLEWEIIESHEREMGRENHYNVSLDFNCDCGNEINIKYDLWEYPIGTINHQSDPTISGGEILNKCKLNLEL